MEIRFHGRGGQGGVTCAKLVAAVYAKQGKSVQAFGDYAGERSGAPVRAYTRVSDETVTNRNKVYEPDHILILDPTLLNEQAVSGLAEGGLLLLNTTERPEHYREQFPGFRVATVDATEIARRHGIGTRTVVIVNTTMAGAFARLMGVPLDDLTGVFEELGMKPANVLASSEAYESVQALGEDQLFTRPAAGLDPILRPEVLDLVDHKVGAPVPLKTGSWRVQTPRYATMPAPCNAHCPAGNDVVGFLQALVKDDLDEAARLLSETTPLAAVCGRVCPAFCMMGCNRREHDAAVNIRALERWVGDHRDVSKMATRASANGKHVAIVGSGPAGLSAAYHLARAGYRVSLFEAEAELGGVLRTGIPVYRLPREVLDRELQGILDLGVEAHCNEPIDRGRLQNLMNECDVVIVATGLQKLRGLEVPGANLPGVEQGIRFLHRTNFRGPGALSGHVVVLGGGNTAMDCARNALRCGAEKVTVAYRRTREEMPAIQEEIVEALEEGVEFLFQVAPVGFEGEARLQAVRLAEVEMGEPDESGRRSPVTSNRVQSLACDLVLLALGQSGDSRILDDSWSVFGGRAYAGDQALNLFGTGDLFTSEGTVVHAIGHGRHVALEARAAMGEPVSAAVRLDPSVSVQPEQILVEHFPYSPQVHEELLDATARARSLEEVNRGLEDASEAQRCFSCGHCTSCDSCLVYCPEGIIFRDGSAYKVDYDYCKGCGLCVTECPRHSMEMVAS